MKGKILSPHNSSNSNVKVMKAATIMISFLSALIAILPAAKAFRGTAIKYRSQRSPTLSMCEYQTQVLAAQPTIEEWLDVADPGLKKATLAMFRSVKEIAYKIRTASCDKMSCFNDFGTGIPNDSHD